MSEKIVNFFFFQGISTQFVQFFAFIDKIYTAFADTCVIEFYTVSDAYSLIIFVFLPIEAEVVIAFYHG